MIEALIEFIQTNIIPFGALGVFVASVLEEIIAPIPSTAVVMTAGFFFLKGGFSILFWKTLFLTIAIPAALGITLGSIPVYYVAYWLGRPVFTRWGKWIGLDWKDVEKVEAKLERGYKDEIIIFALRVIPIVPSVALSVLCGLFRINIKKYIVITFVGAFLRVIILAIIGAQVGNVYSEYAMQIAKYEEFVLVGFAVLVVAYISYKIYQQFRKV